MNSNKNQNTALASCFDEVLAEHPNHSETLLWKLLSFCKLRIPAEDQLESLVKILDDNPVLAKIHRDSWHWIAEGYKQLNRKDFALKYHETGHNLSPNSENYITQSEKLSEQRVSAL